MGSPISLERGYTYEEPLLLEGETGSDVSDHGTGDLPMIRASRDVDAGDWSAQSSGTFDHSLTHNVGRDKGYISVFPADADSLPYDRIAFVDAGDGTPDRTVLTAGSYMVWKTSVGDVDTGEATATVTLKPRSGDPTAGTASYRAGIDPVSEIPAGGTCTGIHFLETPDKNGAQFEGSGHFEGCISGRGAVHGLTTVDMPANGVARFTDSIVYHLQRPGLTTDLEGFPFVGATPQGENVIVVYDHCGVLGLGRGDAAGVKAFLSHRQDNDPDPDGPRVEAVYIYNSWALQCGGGVYVKAKNVYVDGFYAHEVDQGITNVGPLVVDTENLVVKGFFSREHRGSGLRQILPDGVSEGTASYYGCFLQSAADALASTGMLSPPSGVAQTVDRCVIDARFGQTGILATAATTTTTNSIIRCAAQTGNALNVDLGEWTGTNNVFVHEGTEFRSRGDGGLYRSFDGEGVGTAWTTDANETGSTLILGSDAQQLFSALDDGDTSVSNTILASYGVDPETVGLPPEEARSSWPDVPDTVEKIIANAGRRVEWRAAPVDAV